MEDSVTNQLQHYLRSWQNKILNRSFNRYENDDIVEEKVRILQDLCQKGANVNYLEKERGFALIPRVFWNETLIQFFVDRGADVNSQDENGDTALHLAIRLESYHRKDSFFKSLSKTNVDIPNVIKFLLEKMVDPNVTNSKGETVLFTLASRYKINYPEMAKIIAEMLVERGAELETRNGDGEPMSHSYDGFCFPCHLVKKFKMNYLLDVRTSGYLYSPLMIAASECRLKCFRRLIKELGAGDVNACTDVQGYTALHHAANYGGQVCAKTLVDLQRLGANPDKKSTLGRDVYQLAILKGNIFMYGANPMKMVEILELAGAVKISKNFDQNFGIKLWRKAMDVCKKFSLKPSEEFVKIFKLLNSSKELCYNGEGEIHLAALLTVARLSPENNSKFWNVLHSIPTSCATWDLEEKNLSKVFEYLTLLSEEFKRPCEDLASLEVVDFSTLYNLSYFFASWLYFIRRQEENIEERIFQLHSIARLSLACFNKLINETKSKRLPSGFSATSIIHTYVFVCQILAQIGKYFDGDSLSETAFEDNERLLRSLVELDLRDEYGNTLMHLVLENTFFIGLLMDSILDFENVNVNALNRMGFEPVQWINWRDTLFYNFDDEFFRVMVKMADRGAHIDAKNALEGPTLREEFEKRDPSLSFRYDSLKCMCARVLIRSTVPFRNRAPKPIVDFILTHDPCLRDDGIEIPEFRFPNRLPTIMRYHIRGYPIT